MLSDEAKAFHYAVFSAVSQIPEGRVTSYGHIAYLVGKPQNARQVGSSMKNYQTINAVLLRDGVSFEQLPWWRVIASSGQIAKREGELEQKRRLLLEKVEVNGMSVSMSVYGWFPDDVSI
ncbi:hypothetical protein METBIDRAFT_41684 [Metschnikowia bicuspidata var. bicuspidata NRRL YB-4993]|uniref:6-O-methylguanine-DNA methyltransferase n=1 Tax=Metschnikowia bicuspidata var. bicuspidata NRRL YB-4993 TaxID=869754 RepID=A0A1A0HAZ2_9ASCO|nr:hypothetical protein METBIDRAFT_41684 [Metschnikowia bicuspidata var. bicuspidata NRRL YB-4993]OBA21294.1 hypothetical protein METBIDRAFT_41684 [Metschnikowia bicuspidata var. bicuspidata NRRL YB-4993]